MPQPRDPKTGKFVKKHDTSTCGCDDRVVLHNLAASIAADQAQRPSVEQLHRTGEYHQIWSNWPWFTRCQARHPRLKSVWLKARCDRKKNHDGEHALERGFDIIWFS